eukprot:9370407-Prorocentrum_lima.AAC.1
MGDHWLKRMARHAEEARGKVETTPLRKHVGVCGVGNCAPIVRAHAVVPIGVAELGNGTYSGLVGFAHIGEQAPHH